MSSLNDPFDLIETDKGMDNVIPFLAPNKINAMIDTALSHQQHPAKKKPWAKIVWSSGMATAASVMLLLAFFSPAQQPQIPSADSPIHQATMQIDDDDAIEFSELVMLETWETY